MASRETNGSVPIRIYRSNGHVMVAAPLPGLEPRDIALTVEGRRVTIEGASREPESHAHTVLQCEWSAGPYRREVDLPVAVKPERTNVSYGNGVLVIAMLEDRGNGASLAHVAAPRHIMLEPLSSTRGRHVGHGHGR